MDVTLLKLDEPATQVNGIREKTFVAMWQEPAMLVAMFNTTAALTRKSEFRAAFDFPATGIAATRQPNGQTMGFIVGGGFSKLVAGRGNLACLDEEGRLLPWCPATDGPVYALATDGTHVYFGGAFSEAGGVARSGLAAALADGVATQVAAFQANISGGAERVHALEAGSGYLLVGGDYTSISGTSRVGIAAVDLTGTALSWNPALLAPASQSDAIIHALVLDEAQGRVYVAGDHGGVAGTARPGLIALSSPDLGAATAASWDPGLASGSVVRGAAADVDHVYLFGSFTSVGIGQSAISVAGVAGLAKADAEPLADFTPAANGTIGAIASVPGEAVYLAGDFSSVTGQSGPAARQGLAAVGTDGEVQNWIVQVPGMPGKSIHVLYLDETMAFPVIWAGGTFGEFSTTSGGSSGATNPTPPAEGEVIPPAGATITSPGNASANHATWYPRSWTITSSNLPHAYEGQTGYTAQVYVSKNVSVTWTLACSLAPQLSINPSTGAISGEIPNFSHSNPPEVPPAALMAFVTATDNATQEVAEKWLQIPLIAIPPAVIASIVGPTHIYSGGETILSPTPEWTIQLDQPFSKDVSIQVTYRDGTARLGHEYSPILPQQVVIPANATALALPVTIFGMHEETPQQRIFEIEINSTTTGVIAAIPDNVIEIQIESEPFPPPREAYVSFVSIFDDETSLASMSRVATDLPYVKWAFGSDTEAVQEAWQVEIAQDVDFLTSVWDGGQQVGEDSITQISPTQPLARGVDYFARVRVWPVGGPASAWVAIAFRTNTPPLPILPSVTLPADSSTVTTARPVFSWLIQDDPDGDPQHFSLTLLRNSLVEHSFDSGSVPHLFEERDDPTGSWTAIGHAGIPSGMTEIRFKLPAHLSLEAGDWEFQVDARDPYEVTLAPTPTTYTINPNYVISGVVYDGSGVPEPGREVKAILPGVGTVGSALTNGNGDFVITAQMQILAGELMIVHLDNSNVVAPQLPAFAATYLRFPGGDLNELHGPHSVIELRHGLVSLESRGLDGFTLLNLVPVGTPDPDLPFDTNSGNLTVNTDFDTVAICANLRVRASTAGPGEPEGLVFTSQSPDPVLRVEVDGVLQVEEGSLVDARSLENAGLTVIDDLATLRLAADSTTSGGLVLKTGGRIELGTAKLAVTGGEATLSAGRVVGSGGTAAIQVDAGTISVLGAEFDSASLDLGPASGIGEIRNVIFLGSSLNHRIGWFREVGVPITMRGIRFGAGATYNVYAPYDGLTNPEPLSPLLLHGAGGDKAGPNDEHDPGDFVSWEAAPIEGLDAFPGDERVLLIWGAGNQTGTGIQFDIYSSDQSGTGFTLLDTTNQTYYVDEGLTNGIARYYFIRMVTSYAPPEDSGIAEGTPAAPEIDVVAPTAVTSTGIWPGLAIGEGTHFGSQTAFNYSVSGITIPSSSIMVLSETFIIFDLETDNAPLGPTQGEIETISLWSEYGAVGYTETLLFDIEVEVLPTLDAPVVHFVQTGGAVENESKTAGPFTMAVDFSTRGGAPIEITSFECVVDRDILIGGQLVGAGGNLADHWDSLGQTGGYWYVEQVEVSPGPGEAFIEPGELNIQARVFNEYGYASPWSYLRVYVEGDDASFAYMSSVLYIGEEQQVDITGTDLGGANSVWFPDDPDVEVLSVQAVGTTKLVVTLKAGIFAAVGRNRFMVGVDDTPPETARGYYTMTRRHFDYTSYVDEFVPLSLQGNGTSNAGKVGPRARAAIDVVLQNGEYRRSEVDVAIQGMAPGVSLIWDRHYRSSRANENVGLGKGWFNTYTQSVTVMGSGSSQELLWTTATGDLIRFTKEGDEQEPVKHVGKPKFVAQAGVAAVAWATYTDGSKVTEVELRDQTGTRHVFGAAGLSFEHLVNALDGGDTRLWLGTVGDQWGNQLVVRRYKDTRIARIESSNIVYKDGSEASQPVGQFLRVGYQRFKVNSAGPTSIEDKDVDFVAGVTRYIGSIENGVYTPRVVEGVGYLYSKDGQLTGQRVADGVKIEDGKGYGDPDSGWGDRWQGYIYATVAEDPSASKIPLLVAIFPPSRTAFLEDSSESWTHVVAPLGPPSLEITYDYANGYRVSQQKLPGSEASEDRIFSLSYEQSSEWTWCEVADPEGKTVKYWIDPEHGQAMKVEQGGHATTFEYYEQAGSDGSVQALKKIIPPAGHATVYKYEHAASDPLARFLPTNVQRSNHISLTAYDTISVQGRPVVAVTSRTDPRGVEVTTESTLTPEERKMTALSAHSTKTMHEYSSYGAAGGQGARFVDTVVHLDGFGRRYSEGYEGTDHAPKVRYWYYDDEQDRGTPYYRSLRLVSESSMERGAGVDRLTTYTYDEETGYLSGIISAPHNPALQHSPADRTARFHYNRVGQLYRVEYPMEEMGRPETWMFFDEDGRLAREVTAFSSSLAANTQPVPVGSDPQKHTADASIRAAFPAPASRTGSGWIHTVYTYNLHGELIKVEQDTDLSQQATTTQEFYKNGLLRSATSPNGQTVSYTYNDRNLMETMIAGSGSEATTTTYEYYASGNLKSQKVDPGGYEVTYEYDSFDRLTATVYPGKGAQPLRHEVEYPTDATTKPYQVSEYWRDAGTLLNGVKSRQSWAEYDELGRVAKTGQKTFSSSGVALAHSAGNVGPGVQSSAATTTLDFFGNSTATYALTGSNTNSANTGWEQLEYNEYDGFGMHRSTQPFGSGAKATAEYWLAGSVKKATSRFVRLISQTQTQTDTASVEPEYSPAGSASKAVQSVEHSSETLSTTYKYNLMGWQEREQDDAGRYVETEYNFVGLPRLVRTGQGNEAVVVKMVYDESGRLRKEIRGAKESTYDYDSQDRVVSVTRPGQGAVTYSYDAMERVKAETRHLENIVILHEYDKAGNLESRTVFNAGVALVSSIAAKEIYDYNEFGEVISAETYGANANLESRLTMTYNTLGLIDSQSLEVFDEAGSPVNVEFPQKLQWNGSAYQLATRAFAKWDLTVDYDASGRERAREFWDGRRIATSYSKGLPSEVQEFQWSDVGYGPELQANGEILLSNTSTSDGQLQARYFGGSTGGSISLFGDTGFGNLSGVEHFRHLGGSQTSLNLSSLISGVQMWYDRSGNPVIERRLHQGGLSRVMKYDVHGRMFDSIRGLRLTQPHSNDAHLADTDPYIAAPTAQAGIQWRRDYNMDTFDNIYRYDDYAGTNKVETVEQPVKQDNTVLSHSLNAGKSFTYDQGKRIEWDPTTGLTHKYNWRGQLVQTDSPTDGRLRTMTYDAFGRMVYQVDYPGAGVPGGGQVGERSTIFIPNIGFGGDGMGAETVGEVTSIPPNSGEAREGIEALQYTYGLGAVGGGIGWKRLVEFVAYLQDGEPHHRFLHEDTMGSTVAVTDLYGGRLGEVDYLDYGAPLYAPVAVDSRRIANIVQGTHADTSKVTLQLAPGYDTFPQALSLRGMELRVVRKDTSGGGEVYLAGAVLSNLDAEVVIHDPGHAIASAWNNADKSQTAIYDLHAGYRYGVLDGDPQDPVETGQYSKPAVWSAEPCTWITVEAGAFTFADQNSPGTNDPVWIWVGPNNQDEYKQVFVLGHDPASGVGGGAFKRLALQGTSHGDYVGPGKWYYFDGIRDKAQAMQSGTWTRTAVGTTFHVPGFADTPGAPNDRSFAHVTENMAGWTLQPDINQQVFVPIRSVDVGQNTITVADGYAGFGTQGTRFRIYAPPGVQRVSYSAGAHSRPVASTQTRHLYMGYRFESPMAGRMENTSPDIAQTEGRQEGLNFAGLYYTLHRHYDPFLMRFTSPDPIASPFYNLFHYAGNSPARYFDPDGLHPLGGMQFLAGKSDSAVLNFLGEASDGFGYFAENETRREFAQQTFGIRVWDIITAGNGVSDVEWEALRYQASRRGRQAESGFEAGMMAGNIGGTAIVIGATILTGGAAGTAMSGGMTAAGASSGFATFAGVTTGSMAASATAQLMTAGTVRGNVTAADTLFGIGTAGVGGIASRVGAASVGMGGNMRAAWQQVAPRLSAAAEWAAIRTIPMPAMAGLSRVAPRTFSSFPAFKRAMGSAGKDMHWHHIVNQNPANMARFGAHRIHNTNNIMRIDAGIHAKISGHYASKAPGTNLRVRDWIGKQSFAAQRRYGLKVLRDYGVGP